MGSFLNVGLSNALVALILALVVDGLGRACRRPALAHALWLLVLLKLLAPPLPGIVSIPIPFPGASAGGTSPGWWPVSWPFEGVLGGLCSFLAPHGRSILAGFWIAGTAVWLALTWLQVGRFRHFLAAAQPAPVELRDRACEFAQRLGLLRAPGVWLVPSTVAPMVWAAGGRPRLILPARLWDGLDPGQRDALLVHELAHVRRRDHWVRLLELAATALYWWHPAVWWARQRLHEAEELCCDAWVGWALPGSARSYATAMVATVDFLSAVPTVLPAGASGLGRGNDFRHLRRRLTLIMRGMAPRSLTLAGLLAVLVLGVVTLPLLIVPAPEGPPRVRAEDGSPWYVVEGGAREPGATFWLDDVRSPERGDAPGSQWSWALEDRRHTGSKKEFTFKIVPSPTPKPKPGA
jgi:beta-lactamase regulating signal transducer with metallopeptidase domain